MQSATSFIQQAHIIGIGSNQWRNLVLIKLAQINIPCTIVQDGLWCASALGPLASCIQPVFCNHTQFYICLQHHKERLCLPHSFYNLSPLSGPNRASISSGMIFKDNLSAVSPRRTPTGFMRIYNGYFYHAQTSARRLKVHKSQPQ